MVRFGTYLPRRRLDLPEGRLQDWRRLHLQLHWRRQLQRPDLRQRRVHR